MKSEVELAGIEYHGIAGGSKDCQDAVMRLLQFGDRIVCARILSYSNHHGLLITKEVGDRIAIKFGFSSGYGGTGPRCFSVVLQLLYAHNADLEEYEVGEDFMERLDQSALTAKDIEYVAAAKPIRPSRWADYVLDSHSTSAHDGMLWQEFPPVVPFAIIDNRIMDLARSFWDDPDDKLLKGYRRLEDAVRKRTGLSESGSRLFSKVFLGPTRCLHWKELDEGENTGRGNLFTGAYSAHRNPRAHRELKSNPWEQLSELLLLNHLYRLEKEASAV